MMWVMVARHKSEQQKTQIKQQNVHQTKTGKEVKCFNEKYVQSQFDILPSWWQFTNAFVLIVQSSFHSVCHPI